MNQNIMFKTTAFGGFEKQAVLDYIMQLNKTAEQSQSQLSEQLHGANEQKQQLEQSLSEAQAYIQRLRQELDGANSQAAAEQKRSAELAAMVERLNQDAAQYRQLLIQREGEAQQAQQTSAQLMERTQELEAKSREIDQASAQIGRMIIDARTESEQILQTAREQSQEILDSARREADERVAEIEAHARSLQEDARSSVEETSRQFRQLRGEMEGIGRSVADAMELMQEKVLEIGGMMDCTQAKFAELISDPEEAVPACPQEPEEMPESPVQEEFLQSMPIDFAPKSQEDGAVEADMGPFFR